MRISMILAWCAVLCVILTAVRYLVRVSKNPNWNRVFHKLHIPMGLLALLLGLIHGLLAGNLPGGKVFWGTLLLTLNWGSLCFLLLVLLLGSYLLRKPLKKAWMPLHRVLTVALLAALVLHVADVGIHVLDRSPAPTSAQTVTVSVAPMQEPAKTPAPSAEAAPMATPSEEPSAVEEAPTPTPEPTPEPTTRVEFSGAVLTDGVYQGSAQGYKGTITVEVTVEQGSVSAITVLEESDTPNFFAYAASIPDTVVETQSLQVDAVTGATYSSAGLLCAIENALSDAVVEGELQVNEAVHDLPAPGGHGRH